MPVLVRILASRHFVPAALIADVRATDFDRVAGRHAHKGGIVGHFVVVVRLLVRVYCILIAEIDFASRTIVFSSQGRMEMTPQMVHRGSTLMLGAAELALVYNMFFTKMLLCCPQCWVK